MEKIPNEILLKIFSHLEIQDLGRCAGVSRQFHEIAYAKGLWQKLPINLFSKGVPVEFLQHIMKHGIAYINLDWAGILGDPLHFAKQNSLKYLTLDFRYTKEVKKNLLASCGQLEKLKISFVYDTDISQYIGQNCESLKCLQIERGVMTGELATAISKCNQLEELSLHLINDNTSYGFIRNLPQNLKKLCIRELRLVEGLKIEHLKVLVATCSKLEVLFCDIDCCENSTCRHFDEVISIIVGSSF